ncbi:recombinase RecT [Frankia gtarii]|uniref:recombinase RecT n=1 Tax=Frankia gtarii TaxID=2950102 RepID=UPI0021BEB400|nr:recombinase RecT [Frankia gtarii]
MTVEVHQATTPPPTTAVVAVKSGTILELHRDQEWWSQRQIAVLRTLGVKADVTNEELAIFQHVAQRARLDPFAKQIYLVGRYDRRAGRDVYRPQTGIDGFRLIAQRSGRYAGRAGQQWCADDGVWRDIWVGTTPPTAAKVGVRHYDDHGVLHETWATVMFSEFEVTNKDGKPTGKWGTMPANQIAKCGEAAAHRTVFPDETAGLVVDEEMEKGDDEARREHAAQMAEAAVRRAAIQHERIRAQVAGAPANPAERGAGSAPVDDDFAAFAADDSTRADLEGAPEPDQDLLDVLLSAVGAAEDEAQLRHAEQEVDASHGVQRGVGGCSATLLRHGGLFCVAAVCRRMRHETHVRTQPRAGNRHRRRDARTCRRFRRRRQAGRVDPPDQRLRPGEPPGRALAREATAACRSSLRPPAREWTAAS